MSTNYSQEIANAIVSFIDKNGWKNYTFDREKGIIAMRFHVKGNLDHIRLIFDIKDHFFITYGCIEMKAGESNRKEVAEYLTRVNYSKIFGNFEMDMKDGEVRYKYTVDCDRIEPSSEMIDLSLDIPLVMFSRYGDSLLKVMFGMASAEEAIKIAESDLQK